jgi:hypothetical protein
MSCVAISIRSAGPRSPASRLKSSCAATRPSLTTSCATTVTPGLSMSASSKPSKPANAAGGRDDRWRPGGAAARRQAGGGHPQLPVDDPRDGLQRHAGVRGHVLDPTWPLTERLRGR